MPRHPRRSRARSAAVSSNVAAMASGTHESARIASRRATRPRGLEDTTITRAGAATATSRNDFFDPQFLSYRSIRTTNEPNAPRTIACRFLLLASALHAASSARTRVLGPRIERIHLDHTSYAGAGVPQHTRHRRCRSGAGFRIPPNQCAASVTTSRAPAHSARTDRNTHHTTKIQ